MELEQSICVAGFVEFAPNECPHARRVRECDCGNHSWSIATVCKARIGFGSNRQGIEELAVGLLWWKGVWGMCVCAHKHARVRLL